MNFILFDDLAIKTSLLPFTFIRPIAEIRIGIITIREKWSYYLKNTVDSDISYQTSTYLQEKYPYFNKTEYPTFVNGAICPDLELVNTIILLKPNQVLKMDNTIIAARIKSLNDINNKQVYIISYKQKFILIDKVWKIFKENNNQIRHDFKLITQGRVSTTIQDQHTVIYNKKNVFIEEGVSIKSAIINAENGPIYIGKNVWINEGAMLRGALAICDNAEIKMGAKIQGDTTIGPFSKIGGELSNTVIFGFSNKAHDGFLGNSVIGEWCNIGADTNTSNLKNNYSNVKIWDYHTRKYTDTKEQFCGVFMGDHVKTAINTMINTGTVIGICSNVFGNDFPQKFIPSFSWETGQKRATYRLENALEVVKRMMKRREVEYSEIDEKIIREVFELTEIFRNTIL